MRRGLAGALVFSTSASVLVLEILAGRLLAPYVGVTLETFTAVIGTALAGIALGTWAGGQLADRHEPARLIGPELVVGGVLALLAVPVVRLVGPGAPPGDPVAMVVLAALSIFLPAAVLSAVSPTVVKASLADLAETGRVVGRLSGLGTAGAIFGTFVTGFVLVAALPTPAIVVVVGTAAIVAGVVLWFALRGVARWAMAPLAAVALLAAGGSLTLDSPCDRESAYYCAAVVTDPERSSGRYLRLDRLDHSYVDLNDPTHLEFSYTRMLAAAIDAQTRGPLAAVHVGGGGFSMPRWLAATRPGSSSDVVEIDPTLVELAEDELGLVTGPDLRVRIGDGRTELQDFPAGQTDVVVGDAFGSLSVPWHLTTGEYIAEVHRLLRPGGWYLLNVIDYPPLRFTRAEVATLRERFTAVAVVTLPERLDEGGNFVLVAGDGPIDVAAISAEAAELGLAVAVLEGRELDAFVGDARPLSDDFAPVDQMLNPGG
jgi:spermidine synthase